MSEVFDKMRVGGTFFLFGYFRMLGLLLPELRNIGFSLRQQIVVDKGMRSVAGRATKNYRMFPNTTESILFLIKDNIPFSRRLLKDRQAATGLSAKEINERLGVKSNGGGMWSIYTGKNVCGQFPTKEIWDRLRTILEFNEPYERVAQTFNPIMGLSDVWTDIDFCEGERFHPTQKPLKLLERLISVASNDGDVVLDPFFGSGNALIAARNMNRRYIGIEKDENYFKVASQRLK